MSVTGNLTHALDVSLLRALSPCANANSFVQPESAFVSVWVKLGASIFFSRDYHVCAGSVFVLYAFETSTG